VEVARLAFEGARDHPPDGVLAGHHLARRFADRVQPGLVEHVDVRRDLEDRVGRRVEDQLAGLEVVAPVVLDHLGAAVGAVAAEAVPRHAFERLHHLGRKAVRVGRQRMVRHHPHQLPVAGGRLLARPERVQAAVDDGLAGGRHTLDRDDGAEAEAAESRQLQSAHPLGEMGKRVRALVTRVVAGVRQGADAAGIHHDHRRTCHCGAIMSRARHAILRE
jgi:hypothetical protein